MKDTHKTAVQFRKLKGEIIAVFPFNSFTRPASPSEYSDLKAELESIGYNLEVIQKRSHKRYLEAYRKATQPKQIDLRKIFNL